MFARDLVSDVIKPLTVQTTGEQAVLLMHDYMANQMPLVDGEKFVGLIAMEDIFSMPDMSATLGSFFTAPKRVYTHASAHLLEVMRAAVAYSVKVVPVLHDESEAYIGMISAESCLKAFADLNGVMQEGSLIEVEVAPVDYQLSEMCRIVEENNGQVLSAYSKTNQHSGKTLVTLKINLQDLSPIVAAFERYDYVVSGVYNEVNYTEDVKDRYDALMRFLNY
ncbi:MAG: hypothetical protein U0T84_13005 [Chitinophagales bacterium]